MEFEKALKTLLIKEPFYGYFCLSLSKQITDKIPTLAITKVGINCQLLINIDYWNVRTDDEQLALLKHELQHICMHHIFMSEAFNNKNLFNISADMEVNSYIKNLPEGAVYAQTYSLEPCKGTTFYYKELLKEKEAQQQKQKQNTSAPLGEEGSNGDNNNNDDADNSTDSKDSSSQNKKSKLPDGNEVTNHNNWETDFSKESIGENMQEIIRNGIDQKISETADFVEKNFGSGHIPGEMVEIIKNIKKPKPRVFNWKAAFRRLIGGVYSSEIRRSRKKINFRFPDAAGTKIKRKAKLIVAIDTSGSVSTKELLDFFSEIYYIQKEKVDVTLIEFDASIQKITEHFKKWEGEIHGRGGTDFHPITDYYYNNRQGYNACVIFTDGDAPINDIKNVKNLIWVITSSGVHKKYPGQVLYIPKEIKD